MILSYFIRKSITVGKEDLFGWFGFSGLLCKNYQQTYLFGRIQTIKRGGQLYSDSSPNKVSQISLENILPAPCRK